MANDDGFIEHLKELFEPPGSVVFRKMFGGYGLFREGLMFGLVADGTLYLKADEENRPGFEARGLEPFTYASARGEFSMSYHRAPEEAMDNSRDMAPWAYSAFSAAERAAAGKSKKSKKKSAQSKQTSATKSSAGKPEKKTALKKKPASGKQVSTRKKAAAKKIVKKPAAKKPAAKKSPGKKETTAKKKTVKKSPAAKKNVKKTTNKTARKKK